ncbi:hypothetical protein PR202_ga20337 [Eleusine coracana subsp. coracana]|uniref:Uncharacterized protein n=1 Tax=Eleusine coracana subsp. coracana TaxID=191504 RepID=A0AAV5CWV2_ELECO|nr:hypothetical protein PR202_ga20337 [Eleusine coracana subsp. coracana]
MRDDVPDVFMNFAVVCANNGGCDHATCGGGPFLVVCVGLDSSMPRAHACFFSSETGEQSLQICIDYD